MSNEALDAWHAFVRSKNSAEFEKALDDSVKFHSPVVHTPQVGKAVTLLYLETAHDVLANDTFRYEREIVGEYDAVLEFTVEIKGVLVNGVDMISWNDERKITDFKVMIRPIQAVNIIHQEMAARLHAKT